MRWLSATALRPGSSELTSQTPMSVTPTPAMQQFHRMKAEHPGALLFFRMGDFYELFFEDAVIAAPLLDIALTSRAKDQGGEPIPMCGVPYRSLDGYVRALVEKGHRVAIGEQLQDPRSAKGVVKRGVVRVVTPGTLIDDDSSLARASRIAACYPGRSALGASVIDPVSGEFFVFERRGEGRVQAFFDDLLALRPRELLWPEGVARPEDFDASKISASVFELDSEFDSRRAREELLRHFGVINLEAMGCERMPEAATAAGALLLYLKSTQKRELSHVTALTHRDDSDILILDESTRRNLELVENLVDGSPRGTLLSVLDQTHSPMGGRLLRDWIQRPLSRREPIQDRLDAVEELAFRTRTRGDLEDALARIRDLDRLVAKLTFGRANPRDLTSLATSLRGVAAAIATGAELNAPLLRAQIKSLDAHEKLADRILETLVDSPPAIAGEGDLVRPGVDAQVDELRSLHTGGKEAIARIESHERERTGIASLKVRYNRVFGYYIEITRPNLHLVPEDYIRRQTVVSGERFVTAELKDFEERVLRAEEHLLEREKEIFGALVQEALGCVKSLQATSRAIAVIDVVAALAEVAQRLNYVKPRLSGEGELVYREGRHPVVESSTENPFVANDLVFGPAQESPRLYIVTGPNMGGKSTFLRQTGLMVVMAQMGSFVPALEAKLTVCDRLFTRVGASDYLLRGQSTFMVEMQETAYILRHATERSLLLLDEIGRGTATFDGLSIAWAVAEHLSDRGAHCPRTLFATHYHELVDLALERPTVANLHVTAREWKDDILFLRRVEPGGSDRSFGIQVARLSGLPTPVVKRAREILKNLEQTEFDSEGRPKLARSGATGAPKERQLSLFAPVADAVADDIRKTDVNALTPIEALNLMVELKKKLEG